MEMDLNYPARREVVRRSGVATQGENIFRASRSDATIWRVSLFCERTFQPVYCSKAAVGGRVYVPLKDENPGF